MFRKKIMKHRAGLSLVELVVAVTVLAVAIAGVVTAFNVGFMTSARANEMNIASIEAQLQMERLMGRLYADLNADTTWDWGVPFAGVAGPNGFWVRVTNHPSHYLNVYAYCSCCGVYPDPTNPIMLLVTVTVYRTQQEAIDNDFLIRHQNIIHVSNAII